MCLRVPRNYRKISKMSSPGRLRTIPWEELDKVRGIIRLGGDAVEDCDALYDDC